MLLGFLNPHVMFGEFILTEFHRPANQDHHHHHHIWARCWQCWELSIHHLRPLKEHHQRERTHTHTHTHPQTLFAGMHIHHPNVQQRVQEAK